VSRALYVGTRTGADDAGARLARQLRTAGPPGRIPSTNTPGRTPGARLYGFVLMNIGTVTLAFRFVCAPLGHIEPDSQNYRTNSFEQVSI
jgi:hypothetical protein